MPQRVISLMTIQISAAEEPQSLSNQPRSSSSSGADRHAPTRPPNWERETVTTEEYEAASPVGRLILINAGRAPAPYQSEKCRQVAKAKARVAHVLREAPQHQQQSPPPRVMADEQSGEGSPHSGSGEVVRTVPDLDKLPQASYTNPTNFPEDVKPPKPTFWAVHHEQEEPLPGLDGKLMKGHSCKSCNLYGHGTRQCPYYWCYRCWDFTVHNKYMCLTCDTESDLRWH